MLRTKCLHCDTMVGCRAGELPLCDEHSGRAAARIAEAERWAGLTVEQKLDELKARLDNLPTRSPLDERF